MPLRRKMYPYRDEPNLLKRYPPPTVFLTQDEAEMTHSERNAAQHKRYAESEKRHYAAMRAASRAAKRAASRGVARAPEVES